MALSEIDTAGGDIRRDRAFLGHPRGLGYLAFSEGWSAFSYYGMSSLLVLYLTKEALLPGVAGRVIGLAGFRHLAEAAYGPLGPQALASALMGLFSGLVYAVPMIGGWIGDRWLGRTRTVILGAALMTLGHFLLTFYATLLFALTSLLVGLGCFNANLRAQIGELYGAGDLRRAAAFQIYAMSVSLAVIVAPLLCGTLGEELGFAWGFASAGLVMALGLVTYLAGRRWMPAEPPRGRVARAARAPLDRQARLAVLVLILLVPVLALSSVGNMQIFNAYLIWGDANYDLVFAGHRMPVSWLLSLDASISAGTIALSLVFWRWWGRRFREPSEIGKLTVGAVIAAGAPLLLAAASLQAAAGHKVGLGWGIAFHVVNDIGFANLYPIGMALYARAAPPSLRGTMVSVFSLNLFLANMIDGRIGGLLGSMSGAAFWMIHAALVGIAALLLLLFGRLFGRPLSGA